MRRPRETPDNNYCRGRAGLVDDAPPTSPDWADMARSTGDAPGWQAAPAKYQRLRHLMDNDVSLERAWSELNDQRRRDEAAATTVEALMPTVLRDERRS